MGGLRDISNPKELTPPSSSAQRQRAPTIKIDPYAISFPRPIATSNHEPSSSNFRSFTQRQRSLSIENRPLLSSVSRPPTWSYSLTSPNTGEPNGSFDPHNLLTVPGTRSRGGSFDYANSLLSYDGETLFPTPIRSGHDGSCGEASEAMPFYRLGNNEPL